MRDENILSPEQDAVLRALGKSPLARHVYWTGGTLLAAHYFHHRRSLDLDFFSAELLDAAFIDAAMRQAARGARGRGVRLTRYPSRTQYFVRFPKSELKVEAVYFPFPALGKRARWAEYGLAIDSLRDIAANKVHAITERNEPKDVFDLYTMLQTQTAWSLKKIFADVEKKFGVAVDPVHFGARVLAGLDLMEKLRPLLLSDAPPVSTILTFFESEARRELRKRLGRSRE